MKKYKLVCYYLLEGFKNPILIMSGIELINRDVCNEFHDFLDDIGVQHNDDEEFFILNESQYLELNLKFPMFKGLYSVYEL